MSYLLKAKVCEIEVSGAPGSNHKGHSSTYTDQQ